MLRQGVDIIVMTVTIRQPNIDPKHKYGHIIGDKQTITHIGTHML
jgi:hypothetical protein